MIFLLQVVKMDVPANAQPIVGVPVRQTVRVAVRMGVPVIVKVHVEAHADMCVPGALNMVTNIVSICQI